MAQVEPMDIDAIECDFDNKENTYHHSNVLSRTPCTEKGYEELDVSELNMKLRYSVTPAPSPMSKSLTGCLDNKNYNHGEDLNNAAAIENGNLTRSLNSTFNKSKALPLQTLSTDPIVDSNRNASMLRLLEPDGNNIQISVSTNDIDDNLSLPSTSSSVAQTPEATTPTKEIPKPEGSPILRGLKSVLSMFRSSQSPIPVAEEIAQKQDILSPIEPQLTTPCKNESEVQSVLSSTPVASSKQKDSNTSKRSSPLKESVVFNDGLERELQWKDETTIIFKQEKIPVHKLFFQNPLTPEEFKKTTMENLNNTVEYMDISCNESLVADKTMANIEQNKDTFAVESDNEFLDCETTFSNNEFDASFSKNIELENEIQVQREIESNVTANLLENKEASCPEINIRNTTECIIPQAFESQEKVSDLTVTSETENKVPQIIDAMKKEYITSEIVESQENESHFMLTTKIVDKPFGAIDATEKLVENEPCSISHEDNKLLLQTKDTSCQIETQNSTSELHIQDLNATKAIIDSIDNELNSVSIKSIIDDLSVIKGEESSDDIKIKVTKITEDLTEESVVKLEKLPDICAVTLQNVENFQGLQHSTINPSKIVDNIEPLLLSDNMNMLRNDTSTNNAIDVTPSLSNNQEQKIDNFGDFEMNSDIPKLLDSRTLLDNKVVNEADLNVNLVDTNKMTFAMEHEKDEQNITISKSFPAVHSEFNLDQNIKSIDVEAEHATSNLSNSDITATIDVNNEKSLLNVNMLVSETLEIPVDVIKGVDVPCNDTLNKTTSLDLDREVTELTVLNNKVTGKPPSEIPLPDDDDDIEKDIVRHNSITDIKNATFEINDETMHTKNTIEPAAEKEELNHTNTIQNVLEHLETSTMNTSSDQVEIKDMVVNALNNAYELIITHDQHHIDCCKTAEMTANNMEKLLAENLTSATNIKVCELENINNNIVISEMLSQPLEAQESTSESIFELGIQNSQNICEKNILKMEKDIEENIYSHKQTIVPTLQEDRNDDGDLASSSNLNGITANECSKEIFENQVKIENVVLEKGVEEKDEEIITSANNSPYVSVTDLALAAEPVSLEPNKEIYDSFNINSEIASSPPISPKIVSKGYNFNFDDIDDPFATKTKIRMSPTPDSPNTFSTYLEEELKKPEEIQKKFTNNRRKSQPERKRPAQKKSFNSTFSGQLSSKEKTSKSIKAKQITNTSKDNIPSTVSATSIVQNDDIQPDSAINTTANIEKALQNSKTSFPDVVESSALGSNQASSYDKKQEFPDDEEIKSVQGEQTLVVSDLKSTSSSEQYFSLGTSSGESVTVLNQSKNVFNLPEIDDINFNPFATKSKIRQSPPPLQNKSPIKETNSDTQSSFVLDEKEEKNMTVHIDKGDVTFDKTVINDSSPNISNETCSSKNTNDRDATARIVLTEDEDTIEGPFLEADDLKDVKKITEIDTESDMMNFDDIPREKEENEENAELFIDADAFEFLLNQNKSTTVLDSGKESLFLKFDPLFAKRVSSDGVLAALTKVQKRQSTPKKITAQTQKEFTNCIEKTLAGSSYTRENNVPVEEYNEDLTSTMAKPMMVVNPAVSSTVSSRIQASTTPKINRRSLTFTSPAMAVIDRLLSLSGNSSNLNHDSSIPNISTHSETDLAITQLRELLAEKEIHVHNLRCESKELKSRLAALEVQVRTLETESTERLTKINELNDRLSEKTKINKSMATVVEEYERTIASLIAEIEHDKKRNAEERMRLIKERDEQTAHLTSMEVSFSDLHSKYEKNKQIILSCKANEDMYKKSIKEFEENFSKMQTNYELLKQHATSKLNHANQEFEKLNRAHEAEVLKLNAMIKRKDLHITSLEETLAQKTKANEELTAICDELINKVG